MMWTKKEEDTLKKEYLAKTHIEEIVKKLNRSRKSVQHKTSRMGIYRNPIKLKSPPNRKVIDKKYYEQNKEEIYRRKKERIRKNKRELLKIFGGKCQICGYDKCIAALEFHHKDKNKDATITSHLRDYSKEKALKEAEKCIILCANCHRELHHKELTT